MDYRLVSRNLGIAALLIGGTMIFSIPWAFPATWGVEFDSEKPPDIEWYGILGLSLSVLVSGLVGLLLLRLGRNHGVQMFRKEAIASVGLSWALATVLGALPFALSGTARGLDAEGNPIYMNPADWLFESQSGFSTTGATVLTKLEDPDLVPRSILFWRSSSHFLGGLGIIVLFVALLGQGSAGKALMRAEMPGPSKEGSQARMQQTALWFAAIYCGLNLVLAVILMFEGMSLFDALCHAFGTMATGGFSTYDRSLGYFATKPEEYNGALIEMTVLVFMIIAGTNFTLLYWLMMRQPGKLWRDTEWRAYMLIILLVTTAVIGFGLLNNDIDWKFSDSYEENEAARSNAPNTSLLERTWYAFRYGSFQVVSIMTTTGYGTHDFDRWSSFSRGVLFLLMFIGGCAGSTGGGLKVIRHLLFPKILQLEIEHAYHPTVIRPLRLGGEALEDQDLRRNILVYFSLVLIIFVFSWLALVAIEPDSTWGDVKHNKLIDSATGIAATLNNIGPGLGTIGATQNYSHFSQPAKLLFTLLMMMGRLEIFPIIVLFSPGFWRAR